MGTQKTIEREGILLFSPTPTAALTKVFLVNFEAVKPLAKRARVTRKLFGRKEKEYKEEGLVKKHGEQIDTRTFIIRAENLGEITSLLAKEKVKFSIREVWM